MECAHVKKDIWDHPLCADRNALLVQTVHNIKHVSTRNARILVQGHVVLMLGVRL